MIGPIIPPSGIMIIYAYVMGESVAALFLAGIVPGCMVGVGLMIMVRLMADKYDLPKAERIVRKADDHAVEYWVSFVLLRLNIGCYLVISVPLAADASATSIWLASLALLLAATFFLMPAQRVSMISAWSANARSCRCKRRS